MPGTRADTIPLPGYSDFARHFGGLKRNCIQFSSDGRPLQRAWIQCKENWPFCANPLSPTIVHLALKFLGGFPERHKLLCNSRKMLGITIGLGRTQAVFNPSSWQFCCCCKLLFYAPRPEEILTP